MKLDVRGLLLDVRYAFRQFFKSPGFAIGAVLSLMLGIGATTTLFSVVYGVLLNPYPYKDADRIVYFELLNKSGRYQPIPINSSQFDAIRNVSGVEDVLFQQPGQFKNLTGDNSPVAVNAGSYSPNAFIFLGVPPFLGRVFTPADAPGGNPAQVAVLSFHFWQEHYFGRRDVIGKTIDLDHLPYTVIGVMPPRFTWFDSDVYLPGTPTADAHDYWMAYPKLKSGTRYSVAEAEFQTLVVSFAKEDPDIYGQSPRVRIVALNGDVWGTRGTVTSLFAAAMLLLIIGCANASILFLARGTARQHEFAVRASVGASRGRLIRQLLTESVLLSFASAAFGVLAAWWGVNAMRRILPDDLLPHEVVIRLNVPVLLFSGAVALITGILFGLTPALEISRPHSSSRLQSGCTRVAGNAHARRTHRLPIAGQVALTLLLLAGAGGAAKVFLAKLHAPRGFDPDHVFSMRLLGLAIPAGTTRPERAQKIFNEEETIRQSVAQTPGVVEAGWCHIWSPGTRGFLTKIEIQSEPALTDAQAVFTPISPQMLVILRVPLLQGRIFSTAEVLRLAHVALVNQAFVKQYLGGVAPIGQSVRIPYLKTWDSPPISSEPLDAWVEVIGVVGDATNDDLDHPRVRPAVFLPNSFGPPLLGGTLYVRASGDTETAIRSIKARLLQVNPELIVEDAHTLQWELDNWGWGRERLIAAIFALYAGIALMLAATGLYSVVSFAVTQRTQELGIRMALGAGRASVVQLVLVSTAAMTGIGIAAGLIISAILGPLVSAWGGGSLSQPSTLLGAALILVLVAAIACVVPAWRAASVDPIEVLRGE
ncbi:MAG TPA: ADOP family duplicated permease [Candidatus Limnocylindrales bacterium]|nr:ADOP family duplicated permease [Candidatus Limnocylindrales bacterium]